MNLKFSGRGLNFLAHFMATRDIRYYLNGACFTPLPAEAGGGVLGAATNGHVLGMWHDQDGIADRRVIATITKPLVAACKKPGARLVHRDGRLAAAAMPKTCHEWHDDIAAELYIQPNEGRKKGVPSWEIEGTFPDLTRVVQLQDQYTDGLSGAVNATYLGTIQKAVAAAGFPGERFGCGVTMRQQRKDGSVFVAFHTIPEALAIIMPMRESEGQVAWLKRWRNWAERSTKSSTAPLPVHEPSDAGPPDGDGRGWKLVTEGGAA